MSFQGSFSQGSFLSSIYPKDNSKNSYRLAAIGTSLTSHYSNTTAMSITANSPLFYWNARHGWKLEIIERGIGGQSIDQIQARVFSDLIMMNPAYAWIEAGTNDIASSDYTTITNKLKTLYDTVNAFGITLILPTIPMRNQTASAWTDTERQLASRVNDWIIDYTKNNPNVYFVDSNKYLLDLDSTNGDLVSGALQTDGTHFLPEGAYLWSLALDDLFDEILPSSKKDGVSFWDINDDPNISLGFVNSNPYLKGSKATTSTGVTGNEPTNWRVYRSSGSGTATSAIATATSPNRYREWTVTITPSGLAGSEKWRMMGSTSNNSTTVVGDWYEGYCTVEVDNYTAWNYFHVRVEDDGGAGNKYHGGYNNTYGTYGSPTASLPAGTLLTLKTPKFQATGTTARVFLECQMQGDAGAGNPTIKVRSIGLRKVEEPDFVEINTD